MTVDWVLNLHTEVLGGEGDKFWSTNDMFEFREQRESKRKQKTPFALFFKKKNPPLGAFFKTPPESACKKTPPCPRASTPQTPPTVFHHPLRDFRTYRKR